MAKKTFRKKFFVNIKKNKQSSAILAIFILTVLFVFVVSIAKLTKPSNPVYVKVKVSQGFWWANTKEPGYWLLNAIENGDKELDLFGNPVAEILSIRYNQSSNLTAVTSSAQYNIYLTLKLEADKNDRTGKYVFKRSPLSVGSPIELEFPSTSLTGIIIDIGDEPFETKLVSKKVTLSKEISHPRDADGIMIGDTFFDGNDVVFEVISKNIYTAHYLYNQYRVFVLVEGIIGVEEKDGVSIFTEEQSVIPGSLINLATSNYSFINFKVQSIEDL